MVARMTRFRRGTLGLVAALVLRAGVAHAAWTETALHVFGSVGDGSIPYAPVASDPAGNLYGTASDGGAGGYGIVFKLTPGAAVGARWTETALHSFTGKADGSLPVAGVVLDAAGNVYGTTEYGGALANGVVFELKRPETATGGWTESILHSFDPGADGMQCTAGLVLDATGNLYGTASTGGPANNGTVFKLARPSDGHSTWTMIVLDEFLDPSDGINPATGVILDKAGNLYGTSTRGGVSQAGTVFELSPSAGGKEAWTKTVIYSFSGRADGTSPRSLTLDDAGNLFGVTSEGGATGHGTVFKLTRPTQAHAAWSKTILYQFAGATDGESPKGGVVLDTAGTLYGTTSSGGKINAGTVFELTPTAMGRGRWIKTVLTDFNGQPGTNPYAGVILGEHGELYGTTTAGIAATDGAVFRLSP
jgi:uncharacterized repeat protein (TIGR03803 family)